ncbi:serine/threonine-protein kinase [Microbacterium atlanticum]|uniref:serine/threonine-protein kinase n=1 Tax=Microbacterium atlanticum TaxID=2782168 RepID=UPI001887B539|nr:serine/threonine-protein kinase [Microbacterium atlanticum]
MTPAESDETAALLDGRYRLGECVGEGGMARVYRAEDVVLGRTVAIKLIRPGVDGASSERARSEMTVLASLNHPSLVTLYDARLEPGRPEYLAMEFVKGPTLAKRLEAGALPPHIVAHLATELAEALHVVHRAGIVHRDIKPSNVLLSPPQIPGARPRAKLADFGIAYLLDASRLTSPGLVIGTVAYLAPEQVRGGDPAAASDIYSLGLVLLESLTGERVHPRGAGMAAAVARLETPPTVPESLGPGWMQLLSRMISVEPGDRPTAAEVAAAVGKLIERMPPHRASAAHTAATVPLTAPTLVAPLPGAAPAVAVGAAAGAAGAAGAARPGAVSAAGAAGAHGAAGAVGAGAVGGVPGVAGGAASAPARPAGWGSRAAAPDRERRRKRLVALAGAGLAAALVALATVFGISAVNGPQESPEPALTVPAEPSPPAEDTGKDVVVDPGVTEEQRRDAERAQKLAEEAQKKAEREQKKLEAEQRRQVEEERKGGPGRGDNDGGDDD